MALLSPEKFEQVLAWQNSLTGKIPGFGKAKQVKWIVESFDGNGEPVVNSQWGFLNSYTKLGLKLVPDEFLNHVYTGEVKVKDFVLLQGLISNGTISEAEAEAFIQTKYSFINVEGIDFLWKPNPFVDAVDGTAVTDIEEAQAQPTEEETGVAEQVQDAKVAEANQQANLESGLAFALGQLPASYNPTQVSDAIEDALTVLAEELGKVQQGQVSYPENSIPGSALIAGSVLPSKFNAPVFNTVFTAVPPPSEAITLTLERDPTTDRFLTETSSGTEYVGPGRVFRVTKAEYPASFNPASLVKRYRLLVKGLSLGVLGYGLNEPVSNTIASLHLDPLSSDWECIYGMIIRGLPSLGRKPELILAADYVGDVPSGLQADLPSSPNYADNSPVYFSPKTTSRFQTTPPVLYQKRYDDGLIAGSSKRYLDPTFETPDYLGDITGLVAQLVKGETEEQVFAELCGRRSPAWGELSGSPRGSSASAPGGILGDPPMRSICVGYNVRGTYYTEDTLTTGIGISDGMPLRFKDLAPLRRSTSTFTVSLQAWPPRIVENASGVAGGNGSDGFIYGAGTLASDDLRPGNWPGVGIDLVEQGHRDFAFDILVA